LNKPVDPVAVGSFKFGSNNDEAAQNHKHRPAVDVSWLTRSMLSSFNESGHPASHIHYQLGINQ
jgi:hypothetical protein